MLRVQPDGKDGTGFRRLILLSSEPAAQGLLAMKPAVGWSQSPGKLHEQGDVFWALIAGRIVLLLSCSQQLVLWTL